MATVGEKLESLASELNAQWHFEQLKREVAEKAGQLALDEENAKLQLALDEHRAQQLQKASEQPPIDQDNTVQGRAALIAGTMLKAVQAWGAKAIECSACHLLSPPESQFCLYCDSQTSQVNQVVLSPDVIWTLGKRMRCSASLKCRLKRLLSLSCVPTSNWSDPKQLW